MDEETCMVDIAKFYLEFTCDESCGKCSPCRIGTRRLLQLLDKITSGHGEMEDLEKIEELSSHMGVSCLCALGQTASNPVVSTLRYFREEYLEHINEKKCAARKCKDLVRYTVDASKCKGCTLCAKNCPAGAINGALKQAHVIDHNTCIKCGLCMNNCKFDAIIKD